MTETKHEEIISTLEKNDELNRKDLQQRKTKKFNYLKLKPKNQSPSLKRKRRNHSHSKKKKRTLQTVMRSCIKKKKQCKSST